MTIHVTPNAGINPIYLDYIRTVNTPYLDYTLDTTTLDYSWMAEGVNVTVPVGSIARNGSGAGVIVPSDTINFEWTNDDIDLIINLFLQELGIQLPDPTLYEGGTLQETKADQ
jgi:hypothetical protein